MEFTQHSTGLPLGNQVDGLPGALHSTEAVWGPHGVFGPAPIGKSDHKKIGDVWNCNINCPNVSFKFQNVYF